jgi:hypothetical protein
VTIDPEYYLVRLTAQSKGADPKLPGGGKPVLTQQDIQLLASCVKNRFSYWALTGKYCDSEISESNLVEAMHLFSRSIWHGAPRNRNVLVSTLVLDRLAESAVIIYMNPRDGRGRMRTDAWISAYIGRSRNTFGSRYKLHWGALLGKLHELESEGLAEIRSALGSG